ncbi:MULTISPECIES: carboxy terminal-processing peptidase [unclassified Halomonas]|uniref:carboxy terminal-processing peptidase n=1 Tax=unclassified Halomonas TaxID=2609666 RepID=UPI0028867422|nr:MULTISPECIES: carboxy terminal-processing peptidase [unclassified Halomonas]MDT0502665.1 carboxy terminal-processing peptidase [Halomonas sp. PAR7]MDT0510943.1 carboxy terminal-processing peptidase [Halomonas sp. LES1]MDT0592733.1 carboxy terminal-processing peptidase [Halomonas sp. PAR8]
MSPLAHMGRSMALLAALLLATGVALAQPEPTDAQRRAATEMAEALRYGHYADVSLDDSWSRRAFERYLDVLDSQRAFLTEQDVAEFHPLEEQLDDALLDGELAPFFSLYQRYHERAEARFEWLLERLDQGLDFTYEGEQRLEVDREDAPWAESTQILDELWERRLKNAALTLVISDQDEEQVETNLRQRYEGQLNRLQQTNEEDIFGLLMAAVTGSIDPHTGYLSPRQGESFDIQMRLSLEGIGALLQADGEYVKVASLVPGGPAERAGVLEPADRIVGVGQEDGDMVNVVGMRLDSVVELIRGPKGSVVRLDVVPAQAVDMTRSKEVQITRDTVKLEDQAAQSEVLELEHDDGVHRVGVITVPTFYVDFDAWQAGDEEYRSTTRDVAKEIEALQNQGIEGIVLDLRNNGGGALQEANSLIGLFIDRGPTVQVRDARGRISLYGDTDTGAIYDGPLTVLVNRLSASASEIFAGAIQDYGRGLVVGTPTFGKGTVQTLNELSHGEIKLTRAKFYRISGESTQHRGVEPDIIFPSLIDPELIGESSLDNALDWDTVRSVQYREYGEPWRFLETLRARHRERADTHPNFVYLEQQAELNRRMRKETTSVSLNRELRQAETEALEAEQLALENQRREALGLEPLEEWIDARDEEDDGDQEEEEPVEQVQVLEAAHILLDYSQLENNYRFAHRE